MRLAVTGKNGQVTRALQALAGPDLQIEAIGRPELDLADAASVALALQDVQADAVISAAAYTAVDKAESESDMAFAVNRDGAGAVAAAANKLGLPVLHLSTDYVFAGTKDAPYVETDETGPTSVYGQSKLEGEQAIAAATANFAIFRTAWVYSVYGNNFVKTMLRLADTRDELNVVADQVGCPTSAHDIATALVAAAGQMVESDAADLRGIFHLAGSGETSWAGFARYIFELRAEKTGKSMLVNDIATSQYPTPAKRPANSRLDCTKLRDTFGITMPDWRTSTRQVVETLFKEAGVIS
ncbi:dTDP-4-dehydrorhamnose reductase [Rhizobium sp. L1K21]|uniref:dTDP-4-dehydrorhamnose reductase n=1 Tax=Rhizobium sp. L1K21 TaxID=2954933 RepID=UPI00209244ED|nr:dTDP-4-dehydrorhamnose reductase [Rhizobium sp. L1K21]